MEITMEMLKEFVVPGIVILCALVGYFIKNSSLMNFINNKDIPMILGIIGVVAFCLQSKTISVDAIIKGLASGWAAVGAHQLIKQNADNKYLESIDPNDVKGNLDEINEILKEGDTPAEPIEKAETPSEAPTEDTPLDKLTK